MPRVSWHYRQIKCQPARFDLTEFEWRCKGRNDLIDKDIYIVMTHLAPDQYADLNVIGQWLGIPNIINLFYMDQINQAVGRNQGFRQSNQRETKTVLITSKRLFHSVISKCCSEEGSRTACKTCREGRLRERGSLRQLQCN
jgi:hypothetical protein